MDAATTLDFLVRHRGESIRLHPVSRYDIGKIKADHLWNRFPDITRAEALVAGVNPMTLDIDPLLKGLAVKVAFDRSAPKIEEWKD